jgi:hypothetical protein
MHRLYAADIAHQAGAFRTRCVAATATASRPGMLLVVGDGHLNERGQCFFITGITQEREGVSPLLNNQLAINRSRFATGWR